MPFKSLDSSLPSNWKVKQIWFWLFGTCVWSFLKVEIFGKILPTSGCSYHVRHSSRTDNFLRIMEPELTLSGNMLLVLSRVICFVSIQFLAAIAALYRTMSVGRSVGWSVGLSVSTSFKVAYDTKESVVTCCMIV